MKVVFKKKGNDSLHEISAKTESEYKRLLSIANYEIFRRREFSDLGLDEMIIKVDGEKISFSDLIEKIENKLKKLNKESKEKDKKKNKLLKKYDDVTYGKKDKKKKKKKDKNKKKDKVSYKFSESNDGLLRIERKSN